MKTYITSYGKGTTEKGIVELCYDPKENTLHKRQAISLAGKANFAIKDEIRVYLSEQTAGVNTLNIYDTQHLKLLEKIPVDYFYSYGQVVDDCLLLASFSAACMMLSHLLHIFFPLLTQKPSMALFMTGCFFQEISRWMLTPDFNGTNRSLQSASAYLFGLSMGIYLT